MTRTIAFIAALMLVTVSARADDGQEDVPTALAKEARVDNGRRSGTGPMPNGTIRSVEPGARRGDDLPHDFIVSARRASREVNVTR